MGNSLSLQNIKLILCSFYTLQNKCKTVSHCYTIAMRNHETLGDNSDTCIFVGIYVNAGIETVQCLNI